MKPISSTAFYCCGVRMQDAAAARPVCGDRYAQVFMNEDGLRILEAFKDEAWPNASIVARHRIIDDLLRQELAASPDLHVVLIGAGFDSRAYRLDGGNWLELDEPQIINYKNERLPPAGCKNRLQRLSIDFATEALEQKLAPYSSQSPVVVVIEGVFMYLEEDAVRHLIGTLHRLFPRHQLICDLISRRFFEKYSRSFHEKITKMGASFITMEKPDEIFIRNGYRIVEKISIVGQAIALGLTGVPKILFHLFLRTFPQGYSVYVFEPVAVRE